MYGLIHVILKSYFIDTAGQEAWQAFLQTSGLTDDEFKGNESYTSEATIALLNKIAYQLDMYPPAMMAKLGEYYLDYHLRSEHGAMVRQLSDNFAGFINKVNDLHAMFKEEYVDMKPPSFRCKVSGEGVVNVMYYSWMEEFHPFASGLLNAICTKIFGLDVEVIKAQTTSTNIGSFQQHIIFNIVAQSDNPEDKLRLTGPDEVDLVADGTTDLLTEEEWCEALPFHIFFNSSMTVIQMGNSIRKLCDVKGDVTVKVNEIFSLVEPPVPFEFKNVLRFINSSFVLEATPAFKDKKKDKNRPKVLLAGRMVVDTDEEEVVFSGCPHSLNMDQLFMSQLTISDLPLSDLSRDLLLQAEHITEEQEISKKLESTKQQLQQQEQQLQAQSGDSLHKYDLLPPSVAGLLHQGQPVPPKLYANTTLMMCDIPNFGEILPKIKPVAAAKALNEIYTKCDTLVKKYGVYKVRTLEEVYFVASGVPDPMSDHAVRIGALALEMVQASKTVASPISKIPLSLRIGIHSGPVVGTLIGEKMPVYCLFGETVSMTQYVKDYGIPGKIHVSESSVQILKHHNFKADERGDIMVGGDLMTTFLLYGYKDHVYQDLLGSDLGDVTVGTKAPGAAQASSSEIQLKFQSRSSPHSFLSSCFSPRNT